MPTPVRPNPRVAIVGAGVIGLSIGYRLAKAGVSVDVFDRGEAGRCASFAAAGMLAAGVEAEPGEQALLPLCRESQRMWPAFARELEEASGEPVDLREEGTLAVALTRDDLEALRQKYEFQRGLGIELTWLTGAAARELEPYLHPRAAGAVLSRADGQVDNRKVVAALKKVFVKMGGLHEFSPVTAIDVEAGRVKGVVLGDRRHDADVVILAAGAWSKQINGLPSTALPPVRPVKGQMLSVKMNPDGRSTLGASGRLSAPFAPNPMLKHVLWAPKCYLVPRLDGRLLVGATVEEKGFDESLTAGGVMALLEAAWRALPGIEELPIDEMWTGLRPGSRDDAPILGPSPDVDGLVIATGHHRNGILLAPITADTIAGFVLSGKLAESIRPFGVERFSRPKGNAA